MAQSAEEWQNSAKDQVARLKSLTHGLKQPAHCAVPSTAQDAQSTDVLEEL